MTIQIEGLHKLYGRHTALRGVDLTIEEGEFVTLLGPSGCGKTTLLRIIAGFVDPTEGRVLIDGKDIVGVPANRRGVGLVFQSYALFPHMTVSDNVSFGLRMRRVPKFEASDKVRQVLELVDMAGYAERFPRQLSGGQQQRVALARVLAVEPRVLLLDEPLAALDRKLREEMQSHLRRLIERIGLTTIFVTHDQEEALTMSDRIAVMNSGRIVQCASPSVVYDEPVNSFVAGFLGSSNLITGEVVDDGAVRSFRAGSVTVPLLDRSAQEPLGPAALLLRPEHLRLGQRPAMGFEGVIDFVRPVGDSNVYEVRLEEQGAVVQVTALRPRHDKPLPPGSEVTVLVDPEACWVLHDGVGAQATDNGKEAR